MSKRKGSASYQAGSNCGWTTMGGNKERFASEAQARKALRRKRKFKSRSELPHPFFCEDCHGWHLGSGDSGWQ